MTWAELSAGIRANRQPCLILNRQGNPDKQCEIVATEAHHGIFGRNVRFQDWLDNVINACPSCNTCNTKRIADNHVSRDRWFRHQLRAHGKKKMRAWLAEAPEEITWRDDFRRYWEEVNK